MFITMSFIFLLQYYIDYSILLEPDREATDAIW